MLVANDIRNDSRVRKSAVSALRAGARVTLLGLGLDGERDDTNLAGVHLIRVPTSLAYTKGVSLRRRRLRRGRLLTGYRSINELRNARLRLDLTLIDLGH